MSLATPLARVRFLICYSDEDGQAPNSRVTLIPLAVVDQDNHVSTITWRTGHGEGIIEDLRSSTRKSTSNPAHFAKRKTEVPVGDTARSEDRT